MTSIASDDALTKHSGKQKTNHEVFLKIAFVILFIILSKLSEQFILFLLPADTLIIHPNQLGLIIAISSGLCMVIYVISEILLIRLHLKRIHMLLLLQPVAALGIYIISMVILPAFIVYPNAFFVGERYHLVRIDNTQYILKNNHIHPNDTNALHISPNFSESDDYFAEVDETDTMKYTLFVRFSAFGNMSQYDFRVVSDSIRISVELKSKTPPNPPAFITDQKSKDENPPFKQRTYIYVSPESTQDLIPIGGFGKRVRILIPKVIDGIPVKRVYEDYIEFDMKIQNNADKE